MTILTLIRHGQANNTATDEHGYDRLSDLGRQQARWLGEHMRLSGQNDSKIYTGTLTRHQQTAQEWGAGEFEQDVRLNELKYFVLAQLLLEQHDVPLPKERNEFKEHLPILFKAWHDGDIQNPPESFDAFQSRVHDVLHDIAGRKENAIIFTSGGFIAMATRLAMGLDIGPFTQAALPIMNSSVHRFQMMPTGFIVAQFNTIPHLESVDRQHAQTFF